LTTRVDSPLAVVARQVAEAPAPPSRRNPQVGPALEAVVMTALAKEPARRYQTAIAMGEELERVVAGGAPGAVPLGAAGPATESLGRPATTSGSPPTVVVAARAATGGRGGRRVLLGLGGELVAGASEASPPGWQPPPASARSPSSRLPSSPRPRSGTYA